MQKENKILYMCHLSEGTGWSRASIDNILALQAAGANVVVRNIRLTGNFAPYPKEIEDLQKKECYDATHCIQHLLPHHLCGTDKYVKNVAYLAYETSEIVNTYWNEALRLVDEVWVPNKELRYSLSNCGLNSKYIPHTVDVSKYYIKYPEINIPEINSNFKFYTICDINDRKNVESLLRCFHSTFESYEPVSLILKVKKYGFDEKGLNDYISKICADVKMSLRMYPDISNYHREFIVSGNSSEDEIMSIHQYGDCYVSTSHGEGWNIPAFDAMAMNKMPIVPDQGGHKDFIEDGKTGHLVSCFNRICVCKDAAFPDLFTGRDFWVDVDEKEFCETMRFVYEKRKTNKELAFETARKFSYENVGAMMVEKLIGD
jgi:glycosyltransferase involved in cell wall biosynthesis